MKFKTRTELELTLNIQQTKSNCEPLTGVLQQWGLGGELNIYNSDNHLC